MPLSDRHRAALLQVVLSAGAFLLAGVLGADGATIIFAGVLSAVFALLWGLHLARRSLFAWHPRLNLLLLAVTLGGAGPLCLYAWQMAANQRSQSPEALEAVRVSMGGWVGNGAMALGIRTTVTNVLAGYS